MNRRPSTPTSSSTACKCGHRWLSHFYDRLTGSNSGRCLSLKCDCSAYDRRRSG